MNDEGYSNIYDIIHKGRGDEGPDQLGENPGPFYDEVHEDLGPENDLYATRLESHEYDSLSVYTLRNEETNTAFSESEVGDYLLPDDVFSEAQNPQPTEYHEVRGIFMEEPSSAIQDEEPLPEGLQQNGRMIKMESPPISSFTIQHSKDFSTSQDSTCHSIGLEENKATSLSPEIFLFVKVFCEQSSPGYFTQTRDTGEEGTSTEEFPPVDWPVEHLPDYSLMEEALPIVGDVISS